MSTAPADKPVLTLEETAEYLRLPKEIIEREANQGHIPGRRIEDAWRFLRAALDEWLQARDSRAVLLEQAGAFSEDDTLDNLRKSIYAARGRSEVETP